MIIIQLALGVLSVAAFLALLYSLLVKHELPTGLFILTALLFLANMFMAEDGMIGVIRLAVFLILIGVLGLVIAARGVD